jgi:hypothetical protein
MDGYRWIVDGFWEERWIFFVHITTILYNYFYIGNDIYTISWTISTIRRANIYIRNHQLHIIICLTMRQTMSSIRFLEASKYIIIIIIIIVVTFRLFCGISLQWMLLTLVIMGTTKKVFQSSIRHQNEVTDTAVALVMVMASKCSKTFYGKAHIIT